METAVKPVQNGRGRKRRWPAEQKLAVLQGRIEHDNRRAPAEFYAELMVKTEKRPVQQ